MAGLYIHVPFCRKKCPYCNFFSVASQRLRKDYTPTLLMEASRYAPQWKSQIFETLYLGGGTPSLLSADELNPLLLGLKKLFSFSTQTEITLEVNPDDISIENLQLWKSLGFNRLSIGLQSFDEEALRFLERLHTAGGLLEKLWLARKMGFTNISVDLIYGIPGLSNKAWLNTLDTLFQFKPEHISAYALTLEENTIYGIRVNRQQAAAPPDSLAITHFQMLRHRARQQGYQFYEVSNLSLPGYIAKHNSSYWQGIPYLGLGPSAHSFDGKKRWWNPVSINEWKKIVRAGLPSESEILTPSMHFNEYILTRLRTSKGIRFADFRQTFGKDAFEQFFTLAAGLPRGLIILTNKGIRVPVRNFLLSDGIIRRFIIQEA